MTCTDHEQEANDAGAALEVGLVAVHDDTAEDGVCGRRAGQVVLVVGVRVP